MRERKWENHGGRRKGAGRPTGYDRIVLCTDIDKRKPQSIYCRPRIVLPKRAAPVYQEI